jgi:hypothetical protein
VDIPDDIERAMLIRPIIPEWHSLDDCGFDLLGAVHHEDVSEALLAEPTQRPPHLRGLVTDNVRAEGPVVPVPVSFLTAPFGHVQHDRHGQTMVLTSQLDERLAGFGLDIGGIDDRELSQDKPLAGNESKHIEGIFGDSLVVLIVTDHSPASIRREDFGRQEMFLDERALARATGADQDDETEFGDLNIHSHTFLSESFCSSGKAAGQALAIMDSPLDPQSLADCETR